MSTVVNLTANSEASLVSAINSADALGATSTGTVFAITLPAGAAIALNSDLPAINVGAGNTLLIEGGGATLRGDGNERGLFVYSGTAWIANLTITGTAAIGGNGGNGWEGGGGGAGLGGGLFVGSAATVGLQNVAFAGNAAIGGNGGRANASGYYGLGGGGGMGGEGGAYGRFGLYGSFYGNRTAPGGGGGGIGRAANGFGAGPAAGAGIVQGVPGTSSGRYYTASGGGGGGFSSGGGIGASRQQGGFGGGGGPYGSGGFGGGAGAFGRSGGWGGGGSGGAFPGAAGFGGGGGQNGGYQHFPVGYGYYGGYYVQVPGKANGGGGLGAGGNVFVQEGGNVVMVGNDALLGGQVAGGQPGGGNAGPGSALGGAVFLQGYEILWMDPSAGQTLTIGGPIADQAGAGLGPTVQGSGTIAIGSAGRVVLTAASTYTGGTAINAGTLQLDNPQAAGFGPIVFTPGGVGKLDIAAPAPANVIYNFGFGDTIHLAQGPASVSYDPTQHTLSYAGNVLHFDPFTAPAAIAYNPFNSDVTVPCFTAGTRIATARGMVAVEHLRVGEPVCLADGRTALVAWLGHRRVDCRRHPRPADVHPVRIRAHAFGLGRPARDVLLSPDHAVFVDGVLIPVRYLLNDATVAQEAVARVTYWHVELPAHGVLLAEGLPAESFLDTGNRAAFANGGTVAMAHPDFARGVWQTQGCAPLVTEGPARERAYRLLIAQALALGWRSVDAGGGAVRWIAPAAAPVRRRRARG